MTKKAATPHQIACLATPAIEAMTALTVIDAFAAEPDAEATKTPPKWIKIAPRGKFTARDGRVFDVDPEVLVSRFQADRIDVPVDVDHATVKKALFGDSAPAVGWIDQLQARADGLYGHISEWLDEGLRVLSARTHRYISPALKTDDDGKAIWLHSAALVAAPAASMPAVAAADPSAPIKENTMLKAIAQALGLNPAADEAACLAAIATLGTRIDPAIHTQTLSDLQARTSELETLSASIRKDKVDLLLEGAVKAKKISPAQRASYEALCVTEAGLAEVTKLIETLGAGLAASGLDDKKAPGSVDTLSAEDRAIMAEMGFSEDQYRKANGLTTA